MTKEEIREGIAEDLLKLLWVASDKGTAVDDVAFSLKWGDVVEEKADLILTYLDSQGLVLKVDGESPMNPFSLKEEDHNVSEEWNNARIAYYETQHDMLEAGYTKTERLI